MTAQAEDTILWNSKIHVLQGYSTNLGLFSPSDYGLVPSSKSPTNCYRGFVCTYKIDSTKLFLSDLEFYGEGTEYPSINSIFPELSKRGPAIYSDLDIPIKFSGQMRLANGLIRHRNMGFQDVTSYESIFDLRFRDGILVSYEDHSFRVSDMRKAQNIVADYLTKNYVPPWERGRLHETFAFGRTDIISQFNNWVDSFDSGKALRILDEIEESKKDIRWFVECHLAYYKELHRYSHAFRQLEYLGIPAQLLSALLEIKGNAYQEESVVLALFQVLLEVEADGKWGNVLPTVFERQINKANLPQGLVDSVRRVITALYR